MSVLEDHRRAAAASAIEMKPVTADVNQPSRRMVKLAVTLDGATFVKKADQCKGGEQEDLSSQEIAQDPQSAASCLVVPRRFEDDESDCEGRREGECGNGRPAQRMKGSVDVESSSSDYNGRTLDNRIRPVPLGVH